MQRKPFPARARRAAVLAAALAGVLAPAGGCDRLGLPWVQRSALAGSTLPGEGGAPGTRRLLVRRPAAPQVSLVTSDGDTATLSRFAGRVVVLALWTGACEPCRSNLASLQRLADRMPAVAIVPVRLDASDAMVEVSSAASGGLTSYHDPDGRIGHLLGAPELPASFVIDRRGRIAAIVEGTADWTSPAMLSLLLRV